MKRFTDFNIITKKFIIEQAEKEEKDTQSKESNFMIVPFSDIKSGDNLSAEHIINKRRGKEPYIIENYKIRLVTKGYELKEAVYLKPEDAQKLSALGIGIHDLIEKFDTFKLNVMGSGSKVPKNK